jgi:hypothetical protein
MARWPDPKRVLWMRKQAVCVVHQPEYVHGCEFDSLTYNPTVNLTVNIPVSQNPLVETNLHVSYSTISL